MSAMYEVILTSVYSERPGYGADSKVVFIGTMMQALKYRGDAIEKMWWVANLTWNNNGMGVEDQKDVDGSNIQMVYINLNEDNEQHLEFKVRPYTK